MELLCCIRISRAFCIHSSCLHRLAGKTSLSFWKARFLQWKAAIPPCILFHNQIFLPPEDGEILSLKSQISSPYICTIMFVFSFQSLHLSCDIYMLYTQPKVTFVVFLRERKKVLQFQVSVLGLLFVRRQ